MKRDLVDLGWDWVGGIGWAVMLFPQVFNVSIMVQHKEHWICTQAAWVGGWSSNNLSIPCKLPGPISSSIMKRQELLFSLPFGAVKLKRIIIIVIVFLNISGFRTEIQWKHCISHTKKMKYAKKYIWYQVRTWSRNYLSNKHCYWACFGFQLNSLLTLAPWHNGFGISNIKISVTLMSKGFI